MVYLSNNPTDPIEHCEVNPTIPNPETESVAELRAQIRRLQSRLAAVRRAYADLVAACRAALGAHADGEADPLVYLRDELPEPRPNIRCTPTGVGVVPDALPPPVPAASLLLV
ncbi:hypothetical protein [Phytohabitans rumicis]|uniref:hypothetical protein n=1 Tax=Phytohabitans rumicis TaxID=1076125 RepID=UPI0015659F0C|nr:hypothetical protein [Phytohabitans rumicis]